MNHLQQGPEVVIGRLVLHAQLLQLERDLAQALCRSTTVLLPRQRQASCGHSTFL